MEDKPPFASASLEELGRAVGKPLKSHQVQNALLRLEREGFIERAMRGGYAVADPMVSIWLGRVRRNQLSVDQGTHVAQDQGTAVHRLPSPA